MYARNVSFLNFNIINCYFSRKIIVIFSRFCIQSSLDEKHVIIVLPILKKKKSRNRRVFTFYKNKFDKFPLTILKFSGKRYFKISE